jgi:uncharacterized membrane protein YdjX (TVP38/TMEM64 family)
VTAKPPSNFAALFKRLGPAGPLAIIAVTLPALGGFLLLASMNPAGKWLKSHGDAGILIYASGFALAAGLAILPTYSLAALGGSIIGYLTGRAASGERVEALIEEQPRWATIRDALIGNKTRRNPLKTLLIITLLRLPPNSPFAMTNLVLASVRVPFLLYVLGTAIGMAPRTLLVAFLASKIQSEVFDPNAVSSPKWLIPVGVVMLVAVFAVLNHIAKKALAAATRPQG